jgi:prepilin-type N-terminal cleavage/methylation domain-containing protein
MNKKIKNGFSLVELLVVITIIGVLSGIGTLAFKGALELTKARTF